MTRAQAEQIVRRGGPVAPDLDRDIFARMGDAKVVWVLGAGFSAPLGGPMLGYLLSPQAYRDQQVAYKGTKVCDSPAVNALRVYNCGRNFADGDVFPNDRSKFKNVAESLWKDAEEYLDVLDTARRKPESHAAVRISTIAERLGARDPSVESLAAGARRVIAAECSMFLRNVDQDFVAQSERWQPFRDWAASLSSDDTVVTFNYDRVLESLDPSAKEDPEGASPVFDVLLPSRDLRPYSTYRRELPIVLKLHGSVDWRRDADRSIKRTEPEHFTTCEDSELAIGVPGPSKEEFAAEIRQLWDFAEEAIRAADAIVFVGYRFPPTDAAARKRLLGAIRANVRAHVAAHVVLGPNRSHENVVRLECARAGWLMALRAGRTMRITPVEAVRAA